MSCCKNLVLPTLGIITLIVLIMDALIIAVISFNGPIGIMTWIATGDLSDYEMDVDATIRLIVVADIIMFPTIFLMLYMGTHPY